MPRTQARYCTDESGRLKSCTKGQGALQLLDEALLRSRRQSIEARIVAQQPLLLFGGKAPVLVQPVAQMARRGRARISISGSHGIGIGRTRVRGILSAIVRRVAGNRARPRVLRLILPWLILILSLRVLIAARSILELPCVALLAGGTRPTLRGAGTHSCGGTGLSAALSVRSFCRQAKISTAAARAAARILSAFQVQFTSRSPGRKPASQIISLRSRCRRAIPSGPAPERCYRASANRSPRRPARRAARAASSR